LIKGLFYPGDIVRKIKTIKIQLLVFLFCGLSYTLLYTFFSREMMSSLLSWQDYTFHMRLIEIMQDQQGYTPLVEGHPVPYPVLYHHIVGKVSSLIGLTPETSMLFVSCLFSFGSTFLIFLLVLKSSDDYLAGCIGALLCGVGASVTIFFSGLIFFGGAFIFPVQYMIAGFLPNLTGHFFGLFMVYMVLQSKLQKTSHTLFCSFLGTMLILSHLVAAFTYLIVFMCLFLSNYLQKYGIKSRRIGIMLVLSIVFSSPWWMTIIIQVIQRPHLIVLQDAGPWIEHTFLMEVVNHFRFVPLFSLVGVFHLKKGSKIGIFLFFWLLIGAALLFTQWGTRFALELSVPLYMLGAIGMSQSIKWVIHGEKSFFIQFFVIIFVFIVIFDALKIFEIIKYFLIQKIFLFTIFW
jgi:hypothetical protein